MRGPEHRRWLAVLAVLAFAFGTTVTHAIAAADVSARMVTVAATSDMSPPHACNDCTGDEHGDHGMPAAGCIALCNGSVAMLPAPVSLEIGAARRATPRTISSALGRDSSPDSDPPRPAVLS